MLIDEGDFHASAFILGPNDTTVLIRVKRNKHLQPWKFPGGKKKRVRSGRMSRHRRGERPTEATVRETREETGLKVRERDLTLVKTIRKRGYKKYIFFTRLRSFANLRELSDEYEEAKAFPLSELETLHDFHPEYRDIYQRNIKPLLASH